MSVETALPVTVSARAAKRISAILAGEGGKMMLRLAVTGSPSPTHAAPSLP